MKALANNHVKQTLDRINQQGDINKNHNEEPFSTTPLDWPVSRRITSGGEDVNEMDHLHKLVGCKCAK